MLMQTGKMAWKAVCSNKLRAFLTMLGIRIGISALIVLVSIVDGATNSVSSRISDMGADYLMAEINDDKENPLRFSEFSSLFQAEAIEATAPIGRTSVTVISGYTSSAMTVYGTTGSYFSIMDMELSVGRTLINTDVKNNSYIIVLMEDTAIEFFGHADAEGEGLSLNGRTFQVVGVLKGEESESSMFAAQSFDSSESVCWKAIFHI